MENAKRDIKLAIFDMDGVIFEGGNFWHDLHRAYGTLADGEKLTEEYLRTDYAKLVELVVGGLWKNRPVGPLQEVLEARSYEPGVERTFRKLPRSLKTAIISSGPGELARRAKSDLGLDYAISNELITRDGLITGEFITEVGNNKDDVGSRLAEELGVPMTQVLFVGEGDNDVDLAKIVGVAVAYNASSKDLLEVCDYKIERGEFPRLLDIIAAESESRIACPRGS